MYSDWATSLYIKRSTTRRKREGDTKFVNSTVFISNCFGDVWLTNLAVEASPSCDAFLVACFITSVVSKLVISRTAELGASRVEVMQVTLDPYPIRDACRIPVIIQRVPIRARQNYTGICCLLDDTVRRCEKHKHEEITAPYTVQKNLPYKILIQILILIIIKNVIDLTFSGSCIVIFLVIKAKRCTISQMYLIKSSTCFGQFHCPPSGISQHCIHTIGTCHASSLASASMVSVELL
jgi:hypothetical protein